MLDFFLQGPTQMSSLFSLSGDILEGSCQHGDVTFEELSNLQRKGNSCLSFDQGGPLKIPMSFSKEENCIFILLPMKWDKCGPHGAEGRGSKSLFFLFMGGSLCTDLIVYCKFMSLVGLESVLSEREAKLASHSFWPFICSPAHLITCKVISHMDPTWCLGSTLGI